MAIERRNAKTRKKQARKEKSGRIRGVKIAKRNFGQFQEILKFVDTVSSLYH